MPGVPVRPMARPSAYCSAIGFGLHTADLQRDAPLRFGQRLASIGGTPNLLRLRPARRVRSAAREEQVTHLHAEAVELGDVLVQLAAVRAIDIGEHRDRVLGLRRCEHHHRRLRHVAQQIEAQFAPARIAEIVAVGKAIEIAGESVASVGRHVHQFGALAKLKDARDRRRAQVGGLGAGNVRGDRGKFRVSDRLQCRCGRDWGRRGRGCRNSRRRRARGAQRQGHP